MLSIQQPATDKIPATKFAAAIGGGLGVTLVLFAAMQQLIAIKDSVRKPPAEMPVIQLYEQAQDSEPETRPVIPARPAPTPRQLPVTAPEPADTVSVGTMAVTLTGPVLPASSGGRLEPADRGATPLVRIEPRYPVTAARDGVSGWVRLGFSIDESGAVTDVTVLAAEPARVFEREAMAALKRWKYQPKQVDGKTIKQTGMQVQLDFSLDQS